MAYSLLKVLRNIGLEVIRTENKEDFLARSISNGVTEFYELHLNDESQYFLPSENEFGNVEYKLKFEDLESDRFERRLTQMNWRLNEGAGKAFYNVGILDNGGLEGITKEELSISLTNLSVLALNIGANIDQIYIFRVLKDRDGVIDYIACASILGKDCKRDFTEVRVGLMGSTNAGKSTLMSVLVEGSYLSLDDSTMEADFGQSHGYEFGDASSISFDVYGYTEGLKVRNYQNCKTMTHIVRTSDKLVGLFDFVGRQNYIRMSLFNLTSYHPDYVLLLIDSTSVDPFDEITFKYLEFLMALRIGFSIVLTKKDRLDRDDFRAGKLVISILEDFGLKHRMVNTIDDFVDSNGILIFEISCTSSAGISLLKEFIFNIDSMYAEMSQKPSDYLGSYGKELIPQNCCIMNIFQITKFYSISSDTEFHTAGVVIKGEITAGESMFFGPTDKTGKFHSVEIKSIERYRSECDTAYEGQLVGIVFKIDQTFRCRTNGCYLLNSVDVVDLRNSFCAKIISSDMSLKIRVGEKFMFHSLNIAKPVEICQVVCVDTKTEQIQAEIVLCFEYEERYLLFGKNFLLRNPKYKLIEGIICE